MMTNRPWWRQKSIRVIALLFAFLLAIPNVQAQTQTRPVLQSQNHRSFTLKNGMRVYLIPDHTVPAVFHSVWYVIGGMDEKDGKSGIAHFLEHLMFKGTKHLAVGEFSRKVAENGGEDNAFTNYDYTAYYQMIASEHLELVMQMEADRMANLQLEPADITTEREVIIEERRARIDNQPYAELLEKMRPVLFGAKHPYHRPLIGWLKEMEQLSLEDAQDFYQHYYAPNNAILVVVGDVTEDKLKILAEKYYGVIPTKEIPKRLTSFPLDIPKLEKGRKYTVTHQDEKVGQNEWVRIYVAPSQKYGAQKDIFPLKLFAQWLGGGQTSYLYRKLVVEQPVAVSISVGYDDISMGPGMFTIHAIPRENISLETLEKAIDKAIASVTLNDLTPPSVARTKTVLQAEVIYAQDDPETLGTIYGQLLASHIPADYVDQWQEHISTISADAMMAAATKLLRGNTHYVTGYLKKGKK